MPRKYVAKGLRGAWSEEQMKQAVADVINTLRHAATVHCVRGE